MEIKKQIELTQAIYETLTGKKIKQAKEETLATIFSSLTEPTPPTPTGQPAQEEIDTDAIYENQATLENAITDIKEEIEERHAQTEERLTDIEDALQEIVTEIKKLRKPTKPPIKIIPEEPEEPAPKPKPKFGLGE